MSVKVERLDGAWLLTDSAGRIAWLTTKECYQLRDLLPAPRKPESLNTERDTNA